MERRNRTQRFNNDQVVALQRLNMAQLREIAREIELRGRAGLRRKDNLIRGILGVINDSTIEEYLRRYNRAMNILEPTASTSTERPKD